MCVVVPHILARGPAARPRCITPGIGALGIRASLRHQPYRRLHHSSGLETCLSTDTEPCRTVWPFHHHSREPSRSPEEPHRHEGCIAAPHGTHSPDLETSLSTGTEPWRNVRHSIALMELPCSPRPHGQPCADWMPPPWLPVGRKDRRFRLALPSHRPRHFVPWHRDQPCADWMPSALGR